MSNRLPQIVVFQEDELMQVYPYMLPYKMDSNIAIKSIDYDLEDFQNNFKIISKNRPSLSDVYFLHPYKENIYIEQSMAENHLIQEKLALYTKIASLVGASQVKTYVRFEEAKSYELDVEGNLNYKVVTVSAEYKEKQEQRFSESIDDVSQYVRKDNYNLHKNIDEIYELINKNNLNHEIQLKSLVEGRDDRRGGVQLTNKSIKLELTSEVNSLYQLSAKITSPVFKVNANLKESLKAVNRLFLELHFEF